jgi:putative endonuclease
MGSLYKKGQYFENIAKEFLIAKGFKFRKQNYKVTSGEIDLIMMDDDFYVFVEVKAVQLKDEEFMYTKVTPGKLSKIKKTALNWLSRHNKHDAPWRVDYIAVIYEKETGYQRIEYFKYYGEYV